MAFVALWWLSVYDVCRIMMFVTYDVCRIMTFVANNDVCRFKGLLQYPILCSKHSIWTSYWTGWNSFVNFFVFAKIFYYKVSHILLTINSEQLKIIK